nr:hypothetical protein [Tanacetum cinerariifolium]
MDQQNPTLAKILILDTGKFKQWKFRIQQYLQHKHYALWEVIEFRDSYEVPKNNAATGSASKGTATKKGRTVAVTNEDMQKRRNDTAQELWAAILKTFCENEATKKTKKNILKQQYGNFKAEGSKTLQQTFNRLQVIWNMALLSMRANRYWKKTGKKISIQHTDVAGFDKLKVECFNCHKMGHFARECRALKSQERGRRENFRQGSKEEEQAPKALMVIDEVGWDWSYMVNEEENHALVSNEESPTEFALMAKSSTDNVVFDNSLCSKACLSQFKARLVEFKNQENKFCEKIRVLEFSVECKTNRIENLTNELETLKKEKEGLDSKLTEMDQQNPTLAKILILDTGKFKQWKFRIQQYLQHKHYALWEVIEFRDSYEVPKNNAATGSASKGTATKKGRTVAVTNEDMQKRRNDTAQELWAAILKTFCENEATKKTKKNILKQQYGNFKAEGSKTLQQTFNRLQWNMALLSMRANRYWKKTGKKISIQHTDVAGFDKLKVECFNCHKMGHFARECRALKSQERGRRENFRQGSKEEEQAPKALMVIDEVGWDWSYMVNEEENHALVSNEESPTEFALMAKSSTDNVVFDNSLCSKACKKNTDSLNSKIT